jgi:hypothetical protein
MEEGRHGVSERGVTVGEREAVKLRVGDEVEVVGMALEEECQH